MQRPTKRTWLAAALVSLICACASVHVTSAVSVAEPAHDVVGTWNLEGVDAADAHWLATLVLARGEEGQVLGHIDWIADCGASGRESVRGSFDGPSNRLLLRGHAVAFGDRVGCGSYSARLSADGRRLEEGAWSDEGGIIPGKFIASRVGG